VTLKSGGIEQTNFDTYTPLRMSQVPEAPSASSPTAKKPSASANRR
jgi:isoquinoline 1-oxidoreductase beta subunit